MKKKIILTASTVMLVTSAILLIPTISSARTWTITIGVIASTTEAYEDLQPFFEEIIEPDINAYCAKLPLTRFQPPLRLNFIVQDAGGSSEEHLQIIKDFHNSKPHGVDLIIGAPYSSFAASALEYVNENGILLFSPSSTAPALAIPDDNLFRLSPDETRQGRAIAEMLYSRGVESIIVLQRDEPWFEGIYDRLSTEFESRGGIILERIVYPSGETDFSSYLQMAEDVAESYPFEDLALQLISLEEIVPIVSDAPSYSHIYDLEWFGCEMTARNWELLEDAPFQAAELRIFSPCAVPDYSIKYEEMAARYESLTGDSLSFYTACYGDIAWIMAQAVLDVYDSSGPPLEANDVINVISDIASRYYGYTGWCLLNEAGDRYMTDYDIWGYGLIEGNPDFVLYGFYDCETGEVYWY